MHVLGPQTQNVNIGELCKNSPTSVQIMLENNTRSLLMFIIRYLLAY